MDANQIPSSIPFRVAQAYGVPASRQATRAGDADRIARTNAQDKIELATTSPQGESMRARVQPLIAARVEGGVDFIAQGVKPSPGTISLYRHPADKNAAATGVDVGRSIDVRG